MDKGKELNTEFNEVYDAISDAYDKMNEFYMKHCALGQNDIDSGFVMCDLCEIWDSLGKCKDITANTTSKAVKRPVFGIYCKGGCFLIVERTKPYKVLSTPFKVNIGRYHALNLVTVFNFT